MKAESDWAEKLEAQHDPFYIATCHDCGGDTLHGVTTLQEARQHAIDHNHNVVVKQITVYEFNYGPTDPGAPGRQAFLKAEQDQDKT